jgi:hypothetical protein
MGKITLTSCGTLASPLSPRHQRHDLRLLAYVKPGEGAADDHALDFRCALEDREDTSGQGSFRRSAP